MTTKPRSEENPETVSTEGPAEPPELNPTVAPDTMADTSQCANCGERATYVTDGVSANQLGFCDEHKPVNAR